MVRKVTWKEGFLRLGTDKALVGETYRVFFIIMAHIDKDYFSGVIPAEIARILSISRQSVNKAVNKLVETGILEKRYVSNKLIGFDIFIFGKETLPPE